MKGWNTRLPKLLGFPSGLWATGQDSSLNTQEAILFKTWTTVLAQLIVYKQLYLPWPLPNSVTLTQLRTQTGLLSVLSPSQIFLVLKLLF
jgi:hypothetical protein